MAKGQYLTSYQQSIVKRYYANLDTLTMQKLQESVSELYLLSASTPPASASGAATAKDAATKKKLDRLWATAESALRKTNVDPVRLAKVLADRQVAALAALVNEITKPV
jgi:hypothetical protein